MSLNEDLIYMFDIKCKNGKNFYLTSSSVFYSIDNTYYVPNSGLNLVSAQFNESAQNQVHIRGIFEQDGIEKGDNLAGASVKISYLDSGNLVHFISYFCTQYTSKDLEFEIVCESEVVKYNQSLLQMFSKTCRANLGDSRCKISIEEYAIKTEVTDFAGNVLSCILQGFDNGYFKNGTLLAVGQEDNKYEFKILSHRGNNIEVDLDTEFDFINYKLITLIPGCDKNYRTCCYSFNNAVNFRGEPVIPDSNIIEN
ncbi:MAG: phage BR0599 family protein [Rickettsiaceae bacterium]|nr:phage BR0599 family protein [Rickettsiaceae bacterium]